MFILKHYLNLPLLHYSYAHFGPIKNGIKQTCLRIEAYKTNSTPAMNSPFNSNVRLGSRGVGIQAHICARLQGQAAKHSFSHRSRVHTAAGWESDVQSAFPKSGAKCDQGERWKQLLLEEPEKVSIKTTDSMGGPNRPARYGQERTILWDSAGAEGNSAFRWGMWPEGQTWGPLEPQPECQAKEPGILDFILLEREAPALR